MANKKKGNKCTECVNDIEDPQQCKFFCKKGDRFTPIK